MNIKQKFIKLLAAAAFLLSGSANASVMMYHFTVAGSWFDCCGTPFGMALSPSLTGHITVDNTLSGFSAISDFSLATGSKTWTLADIPGANSNSVSFNGFGELVDFSLANFASGAATMYIYTNNTMAVSDGLGGYNACNNCVNIGHASPIPEPEIYAMLFAGLGLLGFIARLKKGSAV